MIAWICPTCGHVTHQPAAATAVGHECPKRDPRNKVSTFRKVGT